MIMRQKKQTTKIGNRKRRIQPVAFEQNTIITTEDSKVKAALICTNEELVIARDTMHLVLENQE